MARTFATLDNMSAGHVAWNVVTSVNDTEAENFGTETHLHDDARYDRAEEFVKVVARLWDSWEYDALVLDRDCGIFADPDRMHRSAPPQRALPGARTAYRALAPRRAARRSSRCQRRLKTDCETAGAGSKRPWWAGGETAGVTRILTGLVPVDSSDRRNDDRIMVSRSRP